MNAEQFRQCAELNETLADYLGEVAQEAAPDPVDRSVATLGVLIGVTAYAVYRLAKNYFDHQRGLDEAELRQLMLDQIEALVQKGWGRDKAIDAVQKVSKDVASLRPDSAAIKAALDLLKPGEAMGG